MLINEKTGISIAVVVSLMAVCTFIASIYYMGQRNREEIVLMREMYMESARRDRTEMLRIEARLSVIEAKLEKVEEWCKRLIDELNKNAK